MQIKAHFMRLVDYLSTNRIFLDIQPDTKEGILSQIVEKIIARGEIAPERAGDFLQKLLEREQLKSTGIGHGVAVPHAILDNLGKSFVALGICREGTDFDAIDQQPVHIILTLVGPLKDRPLHLKLLACIARLMILPEVPQKLLAAKTEAEVYRYILAQESCRQ